jgi:DNA polymerase/3'-5' exonuclease PolX
MLGIASEQGPKVFPLYDEIRRLSWLEPRKNANGQTKMGNRYMALWDNCTGVPIDLFCVLPPAQWGVIMTLRTGPADFSHELMRVARRRGYKCEDGQLLDVRRKQGAPVKSPEERDFFKLINAAWIEPENRK